MKESGKSAVINPKDKFLVDPRIEWHRCSLVIMVHTARAPMSSHWSKLRSGLKAAATLNAALSSSDTLSQATKVASIPNAALAGPHEHNVEDSRNLAATIESMSMEMKKIGEAVRVTQKQVMQQNADMQLLVARIEQMGRPNAEA
jgi:hypothetical protein